MDDFIQHKADFTDGFNDGFRHPNPVYSRAYETGYDSRVLGIYMTDRQIEKMFVDVVRGWYAEWHEENNK